jgi:hypothetical protein
MLPVAMAHQGLALPQELETEVEETEEVNAMCCWYYSEPHRNLIHATLLQTTTEELALSHLAVALSKDDQELISNRATGLLKGEFMV